MKVLLVLAAEETPRLKIERMIRFIEAVKNPDSLSLAAPGSYINYYQKELPGYQIQEIQATTLDFDCIVYAQTEDGSWNTSIRDIGQAKVYVFDRRRLRKFDNTIDEADYPHLNTHVFNRLSPDTDRGFYYFPYGNLFRDVGIGPLDEFGFRIDANIDELKNRPKDHKVIAVFGGSAAWGLWALHDEMFTTQLQERLNAYCQEQGYRTRFTILNYAKQGDVVLNEILAFNLFCWDIHPEIVIAHDGWNDLGYGQLSDSHLLNHHQITYQTNLEAWSEILHQEKVSSHTFAVQNLSDRPIVNFPRTIVTAYAARLRQFRDIVESRKCTFISGLQPGYFSRPRRSPEETAAIDSWEPRKGFFKNMPFLYEKYLQIQPSLNMQHFVNFDEVFRDYDANHTLLADVVHTTPDGETVIAETYDRLIRSRILPNLLADSEEDHHE